MKFSAMIMLSFMLLSGCASQPKSQPDWVAGNSARYDSTLYLTGRGQATLQEEARDRARADLAKIFRVAVMEDSEDVQKYQSDSAGAEQYQSQATRRVTTRTDQIISGIQVAELWHDPATQNYHALAVLPRLQAAAGLRQQIGQLDAATGNHIEQSRNSSDLFMKIASAHQALESQQERDALQKSLQVVDITGSGVAPQWNSANLESDLDELLKRVRIASQVTADSTPGLTTVAAGALARAGFLIDTGQEPDFVLQSRLTLSDLGYKEGWYWQRGVLEVSLMESGSGRVRGTKRWSIKGNAPDREGAIRRALSQADVVLKQELRGAIIEMATSH